MDDDVHSANCNYYEDFELALFQEDNIAEFNFGIGGFLGESHRLTVCKQDAQNVFYHYQPFGFQYSPRKSAFGTISIEQWNKMIHQFFALGVLKWKEFSNPGICDGTHWHLTFISESNESVKSSGDNAYPPEFDDFIKILHQNGFYKVK